MTDLAPDPPPSEPPHLPRAAMAGDPATVARIVEGQEHDPHVAEMTSEFLRAQTQLFDLQAEDLRAQRALDLNHLKMRRWREGLQLLSQGLLSAGALAIAVSVIVLVYDAVTSKAVIVEPFETPPALMSRGVSGRVVASSVLDALSLLQIQTRSILRTHPLSNAWAGDLRVEVPRTGISIGDISLMLRHRLGKEIHVDGDLVQTDNGELSLTVRGEGIPPKTFHGGPGELETLVTRAAEYLYGRAEPSRFAAFLGNHDRWAEAAAFSQGAYGSDPKADRPYLLNAWAVAMTGLSRPKDALLLLRQALAADPTYWTPYNNIMSFDITLGDEEDAWRTGKDLMRAAGGRPGKAREILYQNWDAITWNLPAWHAALMADAEAHGGVGTSLGAANPRIADVELRLHDISSAEFHLQAGASDEGSKASQALATLVRARLALEKGDVVNAAKLADAFEVAYRRPEVAANYAGANCWVAPIEEAADHPQKADAVLKGADSYVDCRRFQGDILDHRGNWAGAQQAYRRAVALAPDLPAAYYSWGVALTHHNDLKNAEAKLEDATRRGPNWADPHKALGDVLWREGRRQAAGAEYKVALRLAPGWRDAEAVDAPGSAAPKT